MAPKRNKQTPKNAFFYFMLEFKEMHGRKYNGMREVADAAGPHWAKMSKDQRQPYEQRALQEKNQIRAVKLTSDGLDVDEIERLDREEQKRIQEMKDDITLNLNVAREKGRIQDELFFIIHINTFCYCSSENRYYPAEIAVSCFSLEDGVLPQNVFHKIIKPGALPLGYASEAKLISEETHQLPPPLAGEYDSNVEETYFELKHFLSTKLCGSKRFPPLYVDKKMMKMVQDILDTWCDDFGEDRPLFKVYNLQYMFKVLRNICAGDNVWPSDTYSEREIEKDSFLFANGISCEFHEISDVTRYCSRSVVVRYAYIICDNCCQDLSIILGPGTHIPDNAMTQVKDSRCSSRASSISGSTRSSRLKPSIRDDDSDTVISFSSKSEWDNQSVSSNLSLDTDSFPDLGMGIFKKKSASTNSQPNFSSEYSHTLSQSSNRSYAGAMGTAGLSRRPAEAPSVVSKDFNSSRSHELPRNEYAVRGERSFDSVNDFPALGLGRGLGRGRKMN